MTIENSQQIFGRADIADSHPAWTDRATEDYLSIKRDIEELIEAVNKLTTETENGAYSPQFGSGSPENVVTSNYSRFYVDTSVPTLYVNPDFGVDTGWVSL